MPTPRKQLVSIADTPFYHVVSRCVRRSWLCGQDPYNGKDYSHRRQWVVDRMNLLTQAFAIEIASYAIMSNYFHLVIRVNVEQAARWSWQEVIEQWHMVYGGNMLSQRFLRDENSVPPSAKYYKNSPKNGANASPVSHGLWAR